MTEGKDDISIVVNGRKRVVAKDSLTPDYEISFDQVVDLAYDPRPTGVDIVYTVTYRNGAGRPTEGRLVAGREVKIHNGTVFNVDFTDRS